MKNDTAKQLEKEKQGLHSTAELARGRIYGDSIDTDRGCITIDHHSNLGAAERETEEEPPTTSVEFEYLHRKS